MRKIDNYVMSTVGGAMFLADGCGVVTGFDFRVHRRFEDTRNGYQTMEALGTADVASPHL